jgi:hypothetical protein
MIPILKEEESLNSHKVMQSNLLDARTGEKCTFSDVIRNQGHKFFPDYHTVDYLHCVLLRHFA